MMKCGVFISFFLKYLLVHEMFDPMRAFMLECLSMVVSGIASKAQHNPDIL